MEINKGAIREAVKVILQAIGENPNREGLIDTPERVARMYEEIFSGIDQDPKEDFNVIFNENYDDIVIVKDIPFYSMCEHHLLPFFGTAHIAYKPRNGKITGLSKLARAVETVARRPQLQERMTNILADSLMEKLDPIGVIVLIEAEHLCMSMRGVKKPGSKTITYSSKGIYKEDSQLRNELLQVLKQKTN